jgi:hypothetical protein
MRSLVAIRSQTLHDGNELRIIDRAAQDSNDTLRVDRELRQSSTRRFGNAQERWTLRQIVKDERQRIGSSINIEDDQARPLSAANGRPCTANSRWGNGVACPQQPP